MLSTSIINSLTHSGNREHNGFNNATLHSCQTNHSRPNIAILGGGATVLPQNRRRAAPKNEYEMPSPSAGGRAPLYIYIPKTAAPRRSSKTENVERSERTGRARETRHPSPPPAAAGPHRLRRDWCLAHRLIRWTDPRTRLRTPACYPVALPVLGANLCCLLRLPVNIVFIVFIVF